MFFGRVDSTSFDTVKRRLIKFLGAGKTDVNNLVECGPYGVDSNPVKKLVAIYAQTGNGGQPVVIGYINKNQLADVGEMRIYSTDTDGNLKAYVWLKSNGDIQLGGNADNAVKYTPLNTGLQNFKDLLTAELAKISTAVAGVGGTYTPGALTVDISNSKIDSIKTP